MSIPAEWFGIADVDGDGKVSGGEAVAFFTRAGLPRASLATLWSSPTIRLAVSWIVNSSASPCSSSPSLRCVLACAIASSSLSSVRVGRFSPEISRDLVRDVPSGATARPLFKRHG